MLHFSVLHIECIMQFALPYMLECSTIYASMRNICNYYGQNSREIYNFFHKIILSNANIYNSDLYDQTFIYNINATYIRIIYIYILFTYNKYRKGRNNVHIMCICVNPSSLC